MKDYYATLGIGRDASDEEIKKAYRKLALKYHPDHNPDDKGSEEKFKEVSEAYSCLSNPEKRAHYDRFGTTEGVGAGAGFGGFGASFGDMFEDIFGDFFGGFTGQRKQRAARGADLRYDVEISLFEAASGTEKEITIPRWETCPACNGSGSKPGEGPVRCSGCNGSGQVRYQQGFFSISKTCGKCNGKGTIIKNPCQECRGEGKVRKKRTLQVKIPAGVDSDTRLRMTGEGELGSFGGHPGDLYIFVHVQQHPFFHRRGKEIYCRLPVSFGTAALGGDVEVPTIEGVEKLKIPAATQSGHEFRLRGKGMPGLGGKGRGDQVVEIVIEVPKKLNARQKELLEEFEKISQAHSSKSFMDRFKDLFSQTEK
ncbi:MAG: molecular chaperone DnaJ [bacterium]